MTSGQDGAARFALPPSYIQSPANNGKESIIDGGQNTQVGFIVTAHTDPD